MQGKSENKGLGVLLICLWAGLFIWSLAVQPVLAASGEQGSQTSATPTYDPLEIPLLPENPSQSQKGKYLFYFHCMPCHGDLGQGLTDEFRQVWEEDHQNCWGRGCHGGRQEDEGFPIPTFIPGIISDADALQDFGEYPALTQYLHDTHPPQYPGKLTDEEYHALAAYLWEANQKPAESAEIILATPSETALTPEPSPSVAPASRLASASTATPAPRPSAAAADVPTHTLTPEAVQINESTPQNGVLLAAVLGVLLIGMMVAAGFLWKRRSA